MDSKTPHPTAKQLQLLYELNQTINSSLDLDEVLDQLMDQVILAIKAERGFVILKNTQGELEFRAARGIDQKDVNDPESEISRTVIEKVLQESEPILTLNAQADENLKYEKSVIDLKLKAVLCAPLISKGHTFGAIYLENRIKAGVFDDDDLDMLSAIAGSAAMAIENARLYKESQQQIGTLHLLHDISVDLTSALDIKHVLTTSLERVQTCLGTVSGSILTMEGDELVFQVAIGEKSEEIKPFRIPKDKGLAGWVVSNNEAVIVNDAQSDPRFFSGADEETGFVTKQIMAAPMVTKQATIGVIEVFNKPGGFSEQDLELLNTIASSAAIALENARLYEVAVDKGRMEKELQMARRVQTSLIPEQIPTKDGWDFGAVWIPAREVSGDYYDFIPVQDEKLGILIADVTDKGMPAALFMAFSRSILRASLDHSETPGESISTANRLICADSTIGMPITAFYALLDLDRAEVVFVNAGHNPPLHYHAKSGKLSELSGTGMLLGAFEDASYEEGTVKMESGDFIVLFTDGVPDAINSKNEDFGEERLRENILNSTTSSASDIVKSLQQAISKHIDDAPQFDDITILVIKKK